MKVFANTCLAGKLSLLNILIALILSFGINSCQQKEELLGVNSIILKNGTIPQGNISTFWGHETFTRSTGDPVIVKKKIGSSDLQYFEPGFTLHIQNGDGSKNLVTGAIVKVDGKQIFGPSDFSKTVKLLSKEVTGLNENSEIEVEVRGAPFSFIDVWIEGLLKPGTSPFDASGGSLTSDDGLLSMSVPANAVSERTFFSATLTDITLPADIPGGIKGAAYLFEPSGIEFDSPITIILKYIPELFSNTNNIRIFHWKPGSATYDIIVPVVDVANHELAFTIDHFSVIGIFELDNSFLRINKNDYVLSDGLLGYYGNFEGKGVYNHTIYLLSPKHNIDFETSETTGAGAIVSLEIFNTKNFVENGTYQFSLPEVMNTVKICDGTDLNGDGVINNSDCDYTLPDGARYISSRLSGYSSDSDLQDYQGMEFKSGSVSITKEGEEYTIILDCIGKSDDVIMVYYKGPFHYYDLSKELYETGSFIDIRDNTTYKTVKIGEQWWMAENLAYLPAVFSPSDFSVTDSRYFVYDYNGTSISESVATNNFQTYGVLYNWKAATEVCPTGWHLPSSEEWKILADKVNEVYGPYLIPSTNVFEGVGKHLKSSEGWATNGNGTNDFGFSAIPGGAMFNGYFSSMGNNGDWWSTSEFSSNNTVWRMGLNKYDNSLRMNTYFKSYGLSIRCIKD